MYCTDRPLEECQDQLGWHPALGRGYLVTSGSTSVKETGWQYKPQATVWGLKGSEGYAEMYKEEHYPGKFLSTH